MFKLVAIFAVVIAAASAGIIGHGAAIAVAPAHVSHASSYANSNLVAIHPAQVTVAHAAPVVAHAVPVAVGIGHGGYGLGGLGGHGGIALGGLGGYGGLGGHGGLIHG